jgi:serine protease Do
VLKVKPGIHALKVSLTGKKDFQHSVTLATRQTTKLEARLEDISGPTPAPVESQDPAYLGVGIHALDDALAKQWKVPDTVGALVAAVSPGGPADKAGIKLGDVVRKFNGQAVQGPQQLTDMVAQQHPGAEAALEILRGGQLIEVNVTFANRPAGFAALTISDGALRGVGVQKLTPALRAQWSVPSNVEGMVVSQIDPQSASAQGGLQVGDVIEEMNRQPAHSLDDFSRLAAELKNQQTLLLVSRRGTGLFLVITPAESKNIQKP